MYTKPIVTVCLGILFLILGIGVFLKEYKNCITNQTGKKTLLINIMSILTSCLLIIIGGIMAFQVYNQLQ